MDLRGLFNTEKLTALPDRSLLVRNERFERPSVDLLDPKNRCVNSKLSEVLAVVDCPPDLSGSRVSSFWYLAPGNAMRELRFHSSNGIAHQIDKLRAPVVKRDLERDICSIWMFRVLRRPFKQHLSRRRQIEILMVPVPFGPGSRREKLQFLGPRCSDLGMPSKEFEHCPGAALHCTYEKRMRYIHRPEAPQAREALNGRSQPPDAVSNHKRSAGATDPHRPPPERAASDRSSADVFS